MFPLTIAWSIITIDFQLSKSERELCSDFTLLTLIRNQCDDYKMFAKYVGGDGNMCGIDARVNALKGVVIDALLRTAVSIPK